MEVEEALRRLLEEAAPLPAEHVSVWEAGGRVAALDVAAPRPVPHFRRAAMDGYVCHDADLRGASSERPVLLRITGAAQMGDPPGPGPDRGEAWAIATGGPMPARGDRVLPLEDGRLDGDRLRITRPAAGKANIALPGEEIRPGTVLATAGRPVPAVAAGALAACGIGRLSVYRRPRIALVATGSELVEAPGRERIDREDAADGAPPAGRVINSNSITLTAALRAAGYRADYRGIIPDRPDRLRDAFAALADGHDVVLSTGGVSIGRHDAVHRTWLDLGARRVAGRLNLKPGGPFFAGKIGETWAVGLSGTPVACLAAFHLLVLPLLRRLEGRRCCVRPLRRARLTAAVPQPADRLRALWACARTEAAALPELELLTGQPEGTVASLLRANALVLLPRGTPALPPGSRVAALMLDGEEDRNELAIAPPVAGPIIVGVVGASGSGKTTVIEGALRRLCAEGVRAAAVKHAAHGFAVDRPASDSARLAQAGARIVVLAGPSETAIRIAAGTCGPDLAVLLAEDIAVRLWGAPPDLLLVEGFSHAGRPVIAVGEQKPATAAGECWAHVPAVSGMPAAELAGEIARVADVLRARLVR